LAGAAAPAPWSCATQTGPLHRPHHGPPSPAETSAWQIGVQSTDIVLVFTTRQGIEGITDGKLTLGADASVAAGPVAARRRPAPIQTFSAEVYSYSRNRGLFAGVFARRQHHLDRWQIRNRGLYGKTATASDIIARKVTTDADSANASSGHPEQHRPQHDRGQHAGQCQGCSGFRLTRPADAASAPAGATSFPMEDAQPGAEPTEVELYPVDQTGGRNSFCRPFSFMAFRE
jgi:hypothetical protein